MSDEVPPPASASSGASGASGESPKAERFGRYLAQQRELRGLSIENVSDQTKLSKSVLRALEAEDFANLPERVFVVGYVKAYAKCVGLSVEETLLRLEETLNQNAATQELPHKKPGKLQWTFWVGGAALAAALAAAGWFGWLHAH